METKIKLTNKQASILKQTQKEKQELTQKIEQINQKELLVLELVLEGSDITGTVKGVKLNEDNTISIETEDLPVEEPTKQE